MVGRPHQGQRLEVHGHRAHPGAAQPGDVIVHGVLGDAQGKCLEAGGAVVADDLPRQVQLFQRQRQLAAGFAAHRLFQQPRRDRGQAQDAHQRPLALQADHGPLFRPLDLRQRAGDGLAKGGRLDHLAVAHRAGRQRGAAPAQDAGAARHQQAHLGALQAQRQTISGKHSNPSAANPSG